MYRLLLILFVLSSCTKEEINQTPCIGNCETLYGVVYKLPAAPPNINEYKIFSKKIALITK